MQNEKGGVFFWKISPSKSFAGGRKTFWDVVPIGHLPYGFHVIWSGIFVLQIVSMLPNVDAEQWNQAGDSFKWILVWHWNCTKTAWFGAHSKPSPARALNGDGASADSFLHLVERSEIAFDSSAKFLGRLTTIFGKILPEDRMIYVSTAVEANCRLKLNDGLCVILQKTTKKECLPR